MYTNDLKDKFGRNYISSLRIDAWTPGVTLAAIDASNGFSIYSNGPLLTIIPSIEQKTIEVSLNSSTTVNASSTNLTVPTSRAVYDFANTTLNVIDSGFGFSINNKNVHFQTNYSNGPLINVSKSGDDLTINIRETPSIGIKQTLPLSPTPAPNSILIDNKSNVSYYFLTSLTSGATYDLTFKNAYSSTTQVNRIYVVVDLRTITGNAPTINWKAINSSDATINILWANNSAPTLAKGKIHLLSFYTLSTTYLAGKEEATLTP